MSGVGEREVTLARLWQEHLGTPFPTGLRGSEPAGIDVVLLDAAIAGCVSTRQNNGGFLDAERHRILRDCIADVDRALPVITDTEELGYCRRLHRMATSALLS